MPAINATRCLRLTEQAEEDLIGIWTFVAENRGSAAASAFVRKIQSRFAPLLVHPELGPRRDDLAPGLRVHFHQKYALYYRYTDSEVTIVRVLHGSRDARALLVEQPDS